MCTVSYPRVVAVVCPRWLLVWFRITVSTGESNYNGFNMFMFSYKHFPACHGAVWFLSIIIFMCCYVILICLFLQVFLVLSLLLQQWQRFHQSFCASATPDPWYWADHRWRSESVSHSHLTQHHPSALKTRTTNLHLRSCCRHGHISGWEHTVIVLSE